MGPTVRYDPLGDDDKNSVTSDTETQYSRQGRCFHFSRSYKLFIVFFAAIVLTIALSFAFFPHPTVGIRCGNSTATAVQNGCVFDQLSSLWVPPHCSRFGSKDFAKSNHGDTWRYWLDGNGTEQINNLEDLEVNDLFYTTTGEHLTHCAFMMLRLSHYVYQQEKEALEKKSVSLKHTHHCIQMLLDSSRHDPEWHQLRTVGAISTSDCSK